MVALYNNVFTVSAAFKSTLAHSRKLPQNMSNILFLFLVALAIALAPVFRKKPHPPYPLGPPAKPFIGNAFDISSEMQWVKYLKWSKRLNSTFYF